MLELLGAEREYLQLHRDTTVQSITVQVCGGDMGSGWGAGSREPGAGSRRGQMGRGRGRGRSSFLRLGGLGGGLRTYTVRT